MNIAVGFVCLVTMAVVEGLPGLERTLEGLHNDEKVTEAALEEVDPTLELVTEAALEEVDPTLELGGGCCPGNGIGCVFGFKTYDDGATLEDVCMPLKCINGSWAYSGNLNPTCGECYAHDDPVIHTYNNHDISGSFKENYQEIGIGKYIMSQPGLDVPALFKVMAEFEEPEKNEWTKLGLKIGYYSEPGIEVQVIVPKAMYTNYCEGVENPATDPQCITKVLVNNFERTITNSVSSFSGTDGTVLIFKTGNCEYTECHINIVGSKGFSIRLDEYYATVYFRIYALPSLQTHLYGLCDTFNEIPPSNYTLQSGSVITTAAEIPVFTDSWKVSDSCDCAFKLNIGTPITAGCVITKAAPKHQACYCAMTGSAPNYCIGFDVPCLNNSSISCIDPGTGQPSCEQGQGNCGGYPFF